MIFSGITHPSGPEGNTGAIADMEVALTASQTWGMAATRLVPFLS
jgi:hypothetical protein